MLKKDAFDELASERGLSTPTAMARFVGIHPPVFNRIYHGKRGAGAPMVRRIVNAPWPSTVTEDDLFSYEVAS